jgi:hypothetical protein
MYSRKRRRIKNLHAVLEKFLRQAGRQEKKSPAVRMAGLIKPLTQPSPPRVYSPNRGRH